MSSAIPPTAGPLVAVRLQQLHRAEAATARGLEAIQQLAEPVGDGLRDLLGTALPLHRRGIEQHRHAGLAPRAVTEMYSYDHDLASFVAIGSATVSEDERMQFVAGRVATVRGVGYRLLDRPA